MVQLYTKIFAVHFRVERKATGTREIVAFHRSLREGEPSRCCCAAGRESMALPSHLPLQP